MIQELKKILQIEDSPKISLLLNNLRNKDLMIELAELLAASGKSYLAECLLNQIQLLTLGDERVAKLWKLIGGTHYLMISINPFEDGDIDPKWSPNGKYIAFTSGRYLYVMDPTNWQILRLIELSATPYNYFRWIDDRFIFVPLSEKSIAILDVALGAVLKRNINLETGITEFSPTGRFFIRRLRKNHTIIWDFVNNDLVADLGYLFRYFYLSGIWSPKKEYLIYQKRPYEGIISNPIENEIVKRIRLPEKYITEFKWNSEETLIAMKGLSKRKIYIYDVEQEKTVAVVKGRKNEFKGIVYFQFYSDNSKIVFRDRKRAMNLFDIRNQKRKRKKIGKIYYLNLNPHKNMLVLYSKDEYDKGMIIIYDTNKAKKVASLLEKNYSTEEIYTIDVSHDNRYVAIGSLNSSVRIFDNNAVRFISPENFPNVSKIKSLAWSPHYQLLSILYGNKGESDYIIYDLSKAQSYVFTIPKDNQAYYRTIIKNGQVVKWSPSGRYMAILSTNGKILIFNTTTINDIYDLWSVGSIADVAWNPNENLLCSVSLQGTIKIWKNRVPAFEINKENTKLYSLVWDDTRKQFITSGANGYIGFIKEQNNSFKIVNEIKLDDELKLFSLEIIPKYDLIATGDNEGFVHLVDLNNNREIKKFKAGNNTVTEIKYATLYDRLYIATYKEKVIGITMDRLLKSNQDVLDAKKDTSDSICGQHI